MRKKDLALRVLSTATFLAMITSCVAPAFADTYYIGNGHDITVEAREDGKIYVNEVEDKDGNIIIKGGQGEDSITPKQAAQAQVENSTSVANSVAKEPAEGEGEDEEPKADEEEPKEESEEEAEEPEEAPVSEAEKEATEEGEPKEETAEPEEKEAPAEEKDPAPQAEQNQTEEEPKTQEAPASANKTVRLNENNEENNTKSSNPVKNVIKIVNKWADKVLDVTLDNVKINVDVKDENGDSKPEGKAALSVEGSGDTTIHLKGENTLTSGNLRAGLEKNDSNSTGKLTITAEDEDASLNATGGNRSAGIGGKQYQSASKIEIAGGKITARGSNTGAGIGGGRGSSGEVTITGGEVDATGGSFASGIGGGSANHGKVTITGGKVTAGSYGYGTAIGGGSGETGSGDVTITGGEVNVKAINGNSTTGIGGSISSTQKTIVRIIGGIVNALGTGSGAGIGGGKGDAQVVEVEINGDAKVSAKGGAGLASQNTGAGAAIGTGGTSGNANGTELTPDLKGMTTGEVIREPQSMIKDHTHTWSQTSHTDAGIDQLGETVFTCTDANCGATKTEYAPITGHAWDAGEITTASTCTETGVRTYTCTNCGETKTEVENALGHAFGEWVPDGKGYKTRTCTRSGCTASETAEDENYVAPAPVNPVPDTSDASESSAAEYEALTVVGAPAYEQTMENRCVVIAVPAQSATLHGSLGALQELKAQGADYLVFRTQLCESTVSVDAMLAYGGETITFALTHEEGTADLTIAGRNANALRR